MKTSDIIVWLIEARRYFTTRPTNGEDSAHWSNVINSEMCDKIASRIDRLDSHNSELLEANTRYLLRARKSEELLQALIDKSMGHIHTRHFTDAQEHLKTPWL